MGLAPVIGFLYAQGFNALAPSFDELVDVLATQFSTFVAEDPLRVTVTIDTGDEQLAATLDEEMTVREVIR